MPVTGERLDLLVGKPVRVYLKDGANLSGILKVNLKHEQRFLLRQRGGLDQVIPYDRVVRVDNLERKPAWWRRLLHR
jgi:hypothetical protein